MKEEFIISTVSALEIKRAKLNSLLIMFETQLSNSRDRAGLQRYWQSCSVALQELCIGQQSCEGLIKKLESQFDCLTSRMSILRKELCRKGLNKIISDYKTIRKDVVNLFYGNKRRNAYTSLAVKDGFALEELINLVEMINVLFCRLKKITDTDYISFPILSSATSISPFFI